MRSGHCSSSRTAGKKGAAAAGSLTGEAAGDEEAVARSFTEAGRRVAGRGAACVELGGGGGEWRGGGHRPVRRGRQWRAAAPATGHGDGGGARRGAARARSGPGRAPRGPSGPRRRWVAASMWQRANGRGRRRTLSGPLRTRPAAAVDGSRVRGESGTANLKEGVYI